MKWDGRIEDGAAYPLSRPSGKGDLMANKEVVFETEIVARTQGELFLYVNDAVLLLAFYPDSALWFYNNNQGGTDGHIALVQAPSRVGEHTAP